MPCYLFTYHAYGSWMPDRKQGYVKRGVGILPADAEEADVYRRLAEYSEARLTEQHQKSAIAALLEAVEHIQCRLHGAATDSTHVHTLVSWSTKRTWEQNRASLKKSITLRLKRGHFMNRPWLSENASRKRVRDRQHFEYLMNVYLPKHRGWKWNEIRG